MMIANNSINTCIKKLLYTMAAKTNYNNFNLSIGPIALKE